MSTLCLIIAVIFFVLVGFRANPDALHSIDLLGFGLAFFAVSFFPFDKYLNRP